MFYLSRVKELTGSVGPYQILRHWATSSSGEIFGAKDERTRASKKVYALIALDERDSNLRVRDALKNVVRASASFTHERVAKMHDVIEHEGRVFVVTDFVPGETLAALLRAEDKTLSPYFAVSIAVELARILHDAHTWEDATINSGQLLHGDVCPQNVMLTYEGNIVLINHGLSLTLSRARPDRSNLRGHCAYFAPERALCSQFLEPNTDLYSLAFVLYEMLTFNRALAGNNDHEVLASAMSPKIKKPSALIKMTRALENVVLNAGHADRAIRYRTGQEFADALTELRSNKRDKWDTRLEVEKLMQRHFQHKARAMRTLLSRWTTGATAAAPRSTSAARPAGRANTSPPGASVSTSGSHSISPFAVDLGDQVRTDDIPPPTGSMPIAARPPAKRMSFVGGVGLCLLLFATILGSTFIWPPAWKGVTLDLARRVSYAGSVVSKAISDALADM